MIKQRIKISTLIATTALFVLTGCADRPNVRVLTHVAKNKSNEDAYYIPKSDRSNYFRYKPIIGTTQPDTKVMINMGKFAKIWIQSYINKNKTFIASHDIIVMVKAPGYISGLDVPSAMNRAEEKTYGANTFTFRSTDLFTNSSNPTTNVTDKQIKQFMNNYEREKRTLKLIPAKQKQLNKYNNTVLQYIKDHKEKLNKIKHALDTKIAVMSVKNNMLTKKLNKLKQELKDNQNISNKDKALIKVQQKQLQQTSLLAKKRLQQLNNQQYKISQLLNEIPK